MKLAENILLQVRGYQISCDIIAMYRHVSEILLFAILFAPIICFSKANVIKQFKNFLHANNKKSITLL